MFGDLIDELNEFDYHQKQHMSEELQRRLSTDYKLATIERVLAVAQSTFPECMGDKTTVLPGPNGDVTYGNNGRMTALACKNFIDEFIMGAVNAEGNQMFSAEDKYIRTRILGERKDQDFWYNTVVMQMDENDKVKGRNNDGMVHYDWTWDSSGTMADHEAQKAIPPITAFETDPGAAEAANTQTQYVQAPATSAPAQTGSTTAAAATTGTEATQSSGTTTAAATTAATAAPTQGTEASQASSSTAAPEASSSTAAPEASTTGATTTATTTTSATTTTTSEATTTEAATTAAATEAAETAATTAVPDATTAAPLDGAVAAFYGGSSYIQSSVETTTTTTTTIAPVAYVEDPVTVFGDAIIAEGGTTEGVVNGTDDLPINGGVLTSSDATSGPDGTAKLEAALSEPVAIPNAGKHDIGPWDCTDMVAFDCCLMIKWLHQDSDVNGLAIQCFFEYKEGTGKANFMYEKSSKKIHIKSDGNGFTKKAPKVIGSWGNLATNGHIEEYSNGRKKKK